MKDKIIIALACADLHINNWKDAHTEKDGLLRSLAPLVEIGKRATELNVPILSAGDLFHKPKSLDNDVMGTFIDYFKTYIKKPFIAISGNHDQSQKNTLKHKSPSYVMTFSKVLDNLNCIDEIGMIIPMYNEGFQQIHIKGIPYLKHNMGFKKRLKKIKTQISKSSFNILIIHTDLPGAKDSHGYEINSAEDIEGDLDKYFKEFNLVLCGHIHRPQRLGKNVYMLGAPSHQNKGDMGIDMGYWEVYSDASMKFIKLNLPEYKYYKGKNPPDDKHIYIPKPKSIKLIPGTIGSFDTKQSKVNIAKVYLKETRVKSKAKKKALIKALRKS